MSSIQPSPSTDFSTPPLPTTGLWVSDPQGPHPLALMSTDVDLEAFTLEMRNKAGIKLVDSIVDAKVERTIEGASTLTVTVDDDIDRTIENSGKLGRKVDTEVDGLFFTLVAVKKNERKIELTFEEREINLLRYYDKWKSVSRGTMTRAEFMVSLITEVKEAEIRYVVPELHKKQPVGEQLQPGQVLVDANGNPLSNANALPDPTLAETNRLPGIPLDGPLAVKGQIASREQVTNANIILQKGTEMGARRKVLVSSIMTAIQESSIINLPYGDRDSVGVFQQRPSQGWPASMDVATDAAAYFREAIANDQANPNYAYWELCQSVQRSGSPTAYAQWQTEAEQFVNAFGIVGTDNAADPATANNSVPQSYTSGDYQFTRGTRTKNSLGQYVLTKEDSWTCMQRLASEVNWRCFSVGGIIYIITDAYLFQSKPFMIISEDSDGIDWINYDYDEGTREATVTVECHIGRWSAPPGSIVQIKDHGMVNGRWLVNDVERSLYDTKGTITLKKPRPVLPEPTATASNTDTGTGTFGDPGTTGNPQVPGAATDPKTPVAHSAVQNEIVKYAKSQLGLPYSYGKESPGVAFDCSGLTQAAYSSVGINIPRVAQAQFDAGPKLSTVDLLQPADLLFFAESDGSIGHVGIYVGDGWMIHAPHTGDVVRMDNTWRTWSDPTWAGATRPWLP